MCAIGNLLYFKAQDDDHGPELWKSDGTEEGTVMIHNFFPGPEPVGANGRIYFPAYDEIHGAELWESDSNGANPVMVADITGDSGSSSPWNLTAVGSKIFFTAITENTGRQLYVYDPTATASPIIRIYPVSEITRSNVIVRGSINPNSLATLAWIEYGPTDSYGSTIPIPLASPVSGSFQNFTIPFNGLSQGTTLHYRFVAWNSEGTSTTADASFTVPVNRPPAATNLSFSTFYQDPLTIDLSTILSASSDPDNDPITLISLSSSFSGNSVVVQSGAVIFTPKPGFQGSDRFDFTLIDSYGATDTAEIWINVSGPFGFPQPIVPGVWLWPSMTGELPSDVFLFFPVIPGRGYQLQRSTNLIDWETLDTVSGDGDSIFCVDENAPEGAAFYRLQHP